MLKKLTVITAVICLAVSTASYAVTDNYLDACGQKAWRGIVNAFTGWLEFPFQISKGWKRGFCGDESNKFMGVVVGAVEGVWHGMGRTISGACEFCGFWAADPKDMVGLPLDADYAWEEGESYDCTKPELYKGLFEPMGKKLVKGLSDGFLGVAEFPGQIVKGVKDKSPDAGIVKAVWYTFSREMWGCYELVSFYLPGQRENRGMAFDQEWPWDALIGKN